MEGLMRFKDYFVKDFETHDEHYYPELKTHYYRCKEDDAIDAVKQLVKEVKGKIIDENELYLEIYFETSDYSCICKVTATSPVETAVDFKVTTYNLFGFGKGKKVIEELYKLLDKKLTFKGVGLFKGM